MVKHIKHDLIWGKRREEEVEGSGRQSDGGDQYCRTGVLTARTPLETLPREQRGGAPRTVGVTAIGVAGARVVARRGVVIGVANVAAGAVVSF